MEIVHVDPGYGKFMELYSNSKLTWTENAAYNPYSDVSFTNATAGACAYVPNLDFTFEPSGSSYKKVWSVKFSYYSVSGNFSVGFCRVLNGSVDFGVKLTGGYCSLYRYVDGASQYKFNFVEDYQSAGFHNAAVTLAITAAGTGSGMEFTQTSTIDVDGNIDYQTYTSSTVPVVPNYFKFNFNISNRYYISNVLVGQASYEGEGDLPSDDGIPADTPIYRLPLGTPVTDFQYAGDGEYIGTANGQTLLQAVNSSNLIATFGDKPVNHIVAYGNPGYRVGSAVSQATGISKSDGSIASHGTHELSFDKTAHIFDVWSIADGSTFSDINGLQVGWRAGD